VKTKLSDCLRPLLLGALLFTGTVTADVRPLDRVVAIVDNDAIMHSQLQQRLNEVQQTIAKRGPAPRTCAQPASAGTADH
jgi:peptidyl-prolyl cis-trans isomerase SurA